jgi:hypothetical protein
MKKKRKKTGPKLLSPYTQEIENSIKIVRVEAPAWQSANVQESAVADSELSQRSQAGCIAD